ncbi:MAG: condensation domain-containing protein, partial [Luteolibacter sp.]
MDCRSLLPSFHDSQLSAMLPMATAAGCGTKAAAGCTQSKVCQAGDSLILKFGRSAESPFKFRIVRVFEFLTNQMSQDPRALFKSWLESGEARLQPLTLPQRELWENSPVPVADPGNHICGILEIKGPLTHEQCLAALQGVVNRHEALRITFLPGKERPLQMIRTTGTAALGFHELAAGEDLEELIQETYRQPFDLLQGPLHRVRLIRRAPNDHVLAFCFHHAIADGWSLGVFTQDLCTAYVMGLSGLRKAVAVGVMGLKNSLPAVAQTYTEWAAAERAIWNPA